MIFRTLHEEGIGVEKKSTPVVSKSDKEKLWETGVQHQLGYREQYFIMWEMCAVYGVVKSKGISNLHNLSDTVIQTDTYTVSMAQKS